MPISRPRTDAKLQKACEEFGKAFLRWRAINDEIAQQDIHEWAQVTKTLLHNSQVAILEAAKLDPKPQFFLSLEKLNTAIADSKLPATQGKFNKTRRDRLKNADPFYCADGRIANATDFFAMFIGQQPLHKKYTTSEELTDKFITDYFKMLRQIFIATAREQMISNNECWEALAKTKAMKAIKEKELSQAAQEALRGEFVPTIKDVRYVIGNYKECPICVGLRDVAGHALPRKFENAHDRLMTIGR